MQSLRSMQQARTSLLVNAAHPHSQLLATQAALLQNSTHPASVLLNGSLQKTLQVSYFFSVLTTVWKITSCYGRVLKNTIKHTLIQTSLSLKSPNPISINSRRLLHDGDRHNSYPGVSSPHLSTAVAWREKNTKRFVKYIYFCL